MPSTFWSTLGRMPPTELVGARLALHHAAQPMAAAAYALLPAPEDHSHANLLWSGARAGFVGRVLPGEHRCFLDPIGLRTGLLTGGREEVAVVELAGKTLDQALAAMADALRSAGEEVPAEGLKLPDYDLPESPLGRGEPFPAPRASKPEELARWFGNGARLLGEVAAARLGGAEVRGWPHHLDLAALLTLDPDREPEAARSVGVGLSPGDGSYAEPYFYVAPWPYPPAEDLPQLGGGARWHTKGFTAAVLTGTELVGAGEGEAQLERAREALLSSVEACLALLGR